MVFLLKHAQNVHWRMSSEDKLRFSVCKWTELFDFIYVGALLDKFFWNEIDHCYYRSINCSLLCVRNSQISIFARVFQLYNDGYRIWDYQSIRIFFFIHMNKIRKSNSIYRNHISYKDMLKYINWFTVLKYFMTTFLNKRKCEVLKQIILWHLKQIHYNN